MRIETAFFALALIAVSCHPEKNRKIDLEEIHFTTTDASELFFKNIRRSEYRVEELPAAAMEIYRYKKPPARKFVSPALIVHWGNDQAFLMIEKKDDLPEELVFLIRSHDKTDTLRFDGSHHRQHAEIALQIYNALLDGNDIMFVDEGQPFPLFTDEEKAAFRRLVFDFLRLVDLR